MCCQAHQSASRCRFTPTCVGNVETRCAGQCCQSVHPHVRGESCSAMPASAICLRFTPTCVGNVCRSCSQCVCTPVHPHVRGVIFVSILPCSQYPVCHPHVRGECDQPNTRSTSEPGSPPRAWGDVCSTTLWTGPFPVHPHVRGECQRRTGIPPELVGSPPRAWGMCCQAHQSASRCRFTPTCVGNVACLRSLSSALGSPPRAWGMLVIALPRAQRFRFTPTRVGNVVATSTRRCERFTPTCVGNVSSSCSPLRVPSGSPPRAWGMYYETAKTYTDSRCLFTIPQRRVRACGSAAPTSYHPSAYGSA